MVVSPQRQRIAWFAWTILLVSSLVALRVLNSRATASAHEETAGVADSRFGFRLEESAKTLGVDFVHQGPTFDARLAHIMPQVAAMGAAVAVADFDRDGWQDFYVTNSGEGSLNRLYRNQGNGTFTDVAAQMGVADVNQRGHRRVDGCGLGRLRQRWLGRSVPLSLRPSGTVSQR